MKRLFTSESVTEGHPDKICDQISDRILDSILEQDPYARVACETCCTTDMVTVMGEITTTASVDIEGTVRRVIADIGYDRDEYGFNASTCAIHNYIHEQSPDIAMGVDMSAEAKAGDSDGFETGAGDQGLMFGYACNETEELMPLPISLAHRMAKKLAEVRKNGTIPYLRPDGKTQVTVEYDGKRPLRIDTVVVSTQHDPGIPHSEIEKDVYENVILKTIPAELMDANTVVHINPTGNFVIGGPTGDSGLTGRKIIVDTYGGYSRHGGGAFSGKDPTKVDRSACYMARYIAKNMVAAGVAEKCEVQIAYAIGIAHPVSVMLDTFCTGRFPDEELAGYVMDRIDMRPGAIIERLGLRSPIYGDLASYGHMGREELNVGWEKTDEAPRIRKYFGLE